MRKPFTVVALGLALSLAWTPATFAQDSSQNVENTGFEETTTVVATTGAFERIYDPSVQGQPPLDQGPDGPWYFNDHSFVRDRESGEWHLYGITHPEPGSPHDEKVFGHASADALTQSPWKEHPFALAATGADTDPGEPGDSYIWAPDVVFHGGTYYMFFTGNAPEPDSPNKIQLATSTDLKHWTRHPGNPLFEEGLGARDMMVTRVRDQWVMYYLGTSSEPERGNYIVAYRTSDDLLHWSDRKVAFRHPDTSVHAAPTESPFVVRNGNDWYMFMCCGEGNNYGSEYRKTTVYRSNDPFDFDIDDRAGAIDAHAAEVIKDGNGDWYVSHAGWGQGGVYLAPLDFTAEKVITGRVVTTPYYRMVVETSPETAITSLAVDPDGGGDDYREVLDTDYRSTTPYLAVGRWGDTDRPGPAQDVQVSDDGRRMAVRGIPMGDEPVTVDWTFELAEETFDFSLDWHVDGELSAKAWEVAWSWNTLLPQVGDPSDLTRQGDASGFSDWTIAFDDEVSLAAAYRGESAWSEDNRYFVRESVMWQPLWQPGGRELPPGDYEGGTWRMGASGRPADTELAERLHASLNE